MSLVLVNLHNWTDCNCLSILFSDDVVDAWESFLKKEKNHVDAGGIPIIDNLLGYVDTLKNHFNEAEFHTIIATIHRVHSQLLRLLPHITSPNYREVNNKLTHQVEELINAHITKTATDKHLQELLEDSYTAYTTID